MVDGSVENRRKIVAEPQDFSANVDIECEPARLFALLDITGDRYWRALLGDRIDCLSDQRYRRTDARAADLELEVAVVDREPGHSIELSVRGDGHEVDWSTSHERYAIELLPNGLSRLTLTVEVTPRERISRKAYRRAKALFAIAVANTVERIRLMAERGSEAARRVDRQPSALCAVPVI